MLRLLIGTGVLLMLVGFGAAGWQYWQDNFASIAVPAAETAVQETPAASQNWLISPTGNLVPQAEVRAYLAQERFVPGRVVTVTRTARLIDLLVEGEKLPETPYLQVFADIRAPMIAKALCPVVMERIALSCAAHSARVVEDSVDPLLKTARFRAELVYRLKPEEAELPDLAAHILETDNLLLDLSADPAATTSAEAALAHAVDTAVQACATEGRGDMCRILGLSLDWAPDSPPSAQAKIAWLAPLPEGMFPAPPLEPPSED